jgi:superoxide dismutase, Cu-Zn family
MNSDKGICVLHQTKYKGHILFTQMKKYCKIEIKLEGLPPGKRGFHIHEKGNLLDGCKSLCAHYNPHNNNHGGLNDEVSHAGDLGNIEVNTDGKVEMVIKAKKITVKEIIGRSIVIHQKEDDLGNGGDEESLRTGNAGKRIACGIIGYY